MECILFPISYEEFIYVAVFYSLCYASGRSNWDLILWGITSATYISIPNITDIIILPVHRYNTSLISLILSHYLHGYEVRLSFTFESPCYSPFSRMDIVMTVIYRETRVSINLGNRLSPNHSALNSNQSTELVNKIEFTPRWYNRILYSSPGITNICD